MAGPSSSEISLTIDRDVALVLFEFLSRTVDDGDGEALADFLEDEAEVPALWAMLAALESVLEEPSEHYERKVDKARASVMKRFGDAFPSRED